MLIFNRIILLLFYVSTTFYLLECRKHQLNIQLDSRPYFTISSFGFLAGGLLTVDVHAIRVDEATHLDTFGFALSRTDSDMMNPFMNGLLAHCVLAKPIPVVASSSAVVHLVADLKNGRLDIKCSEGISGLLIGPSVDDVTVATDDLTRRSSAIASVTGSNRSDLPSLDHLYGNELCASFATIPLQVAVQDKVTTIKTRFVVNIWNDSGKGLYSVSFHNCINYGHPKSPINMTVEMVERNKDSYLSAGEMWLPTLYFAMFCVFFVSSVVWVKVIRKSTRANVYHTHYIMAALGFVKSVSLLFHGANFHVIEDNGYHMETWAVLYYITHLIKGALLFITILLLGTGWTFIKHVLSDKEKKMFMIVVPLQLFGNVARIILEESEEGDSDRTRWRELLYLIDILCCCFILVPVVWSIRHLQEASKTDGKAGMNLRKLQLFRHFYVMIVCYIYFTRIVVFVLQMMVPFQFEWVDELFRELVTFLFLAVTAIKFRPANNNPYFQIPLSDDESDSDIVLVDCEGEIRNRARANSGADFDSPETEPMITQTSR